MNDLFDQSRPPRADARVIAIRGAREHNLKNVDLDIPRDRLVVITGLSGSGKSSLAFDTIYAEGQRRYVESLSAYARQFLEMMQKPDVDQIDGLSPAISIEQKTTSRNPRSTVGTVTEIYDYMRLLWARIGVPYSPATGLPIESQTVSQMVDRVLALPEGTRLYLLAPVVRGRKGEYRKELAEFLKKGFQRVKIDGKFYEIAEAPALDKKFKHDIDVVVDRVVVRAGHRAAAGGEFRDRAEARGRHGGGGVRGCAAHRPPRAAREAAARSRVRGNVVQRKLPTRIAFGVKPRRSHDSRAKGDERQKNRQARRRSSTAPTASDLLRKIRLPGFGLHHFRDRAAAVLVQQSVRRLPGVRRARRRAEDRRRSRDPRQGRDAAQGRDRAVVALVVALLPADARRAGEASTTSRSTPSGRTCPRRRRTRSSTAPARTRSVSSMTTACAATRPRSRSRA